MQARRTTEDIKREFGRDRLLQLAEAKGLARQGHRIQCPARCSTDKRRATVGENGGVGVFNCKGCGASGSVIDLLMLADVIDEAEAIRLADELAGNLPPPAPRRTSKDERRDIDPRPIWDSFRTDDAPGFAYLKSRGLERAVELDFVRFNTGESDDPWTNGKAREGFRVALPLRNPFGELVSFQLRAIRPPRNPKSPVKLSLFGPTTSRAVFGDPMAARTAPLVHVTEGMADTLASMCTGAVTVGVPGISQVLDVLGCLGNVKGRAVVLFPQNDIDGLSEGWFAKLEGELRQRGASVRIVQTPEGHKDPAEWLQAVGLEEFTLAITSAAQVVALPRREREEHALQEAAETQGGDVVDLRRGEGQPPTRGARTSGGDSESDPRPVIQISPDEHLVNADAIAALANDENVFQRNAMLVHVTRDLAPTEDRFGTKRPKDAPRIAALPPALLQERLAANIRWEKFSRQRKEWEPAHPPDFAVKAIHARGSWAGIRKLNGVSEVPVLREDGSVLQTHGFDIATGLIYEPTAEYLPVPDAPTLADARAAVDELLEIVCDFPFESDAFKAAFIAALLTPFARPAYDGPTPNFHIDATVPGSGKTLLVDAIGVLFSGREVPRTPFSNRDEEMAKKIVSIALAADPIILLDNIKTTFQSEALEAVLTSTRWGDRQLGGNDKPPLEIKTIWFSTGNNTNFGSDIFRRTLPIRLAPQTERPHDRSDFKHNPLLPWVRAQRPRLVRAALTVLRAYCVAGRPRALDKSWGSFEGWSSLVRQAVVWAGLDDPCAPRVELEESSDQDKGALRNLLVGLRELNPGRRGLTLREITARLELDSQRARIEERPERYERLRMALEALADWPSAKNASRRLTYEFRKLRGRIVGGDRLDHGSKDKDDVVRWTVYPLSTGGDGGDGGDDGSDARKNGTPQQGAFFVGTNSASPPSPPSPPPAYSDDEVIDDTGWEQ